MKNEPDNVSDYAIALKLDSLASGLVYTMGEILRYQDHDDSEQTIYPLLANLNRYYILAVHELEKLHARNEPLAKLNEDPKTRAVWKRYDILEGNEVDILEYVKDFRNMGSFTDHAIQVKRLAIIAGKEEATPTPKLQDLFDKGGHAITDAVEYINKNKPVDPRSKRGRNYIRSYSLAYKDDGSIVVNDVLALKKTQSGSAPRKLMEQAVKHPYEPFTPELGQLSRSFSSVLNDMGIIGIYKKLFFPVATKDSVTFRPIVDRSRAEDEGLYLEELDKRLKELGAKTHDSLDGEISDEPMSKEDKALFEQLAAQYPIKEDENDT